MNPLFAALPPKQKRKTVLSCAGKDPFIADLIHTLTDYGLDIRFSFTNTVGAYHPFALSTQSLDSTEKQAQFTRGFWRKAEEGAFKVHITLPCAASTGKNASTLIHELVHAWQDMNGLYFLPLQEENTFPIALDAYSDIVAILFNEAWAQTETIRICWAINNKSGDARAWKGALSHSDFGTLAQKYNEDLQSGIDEARAAANTIERWYEGAHREFYERHALHIHKTNFTRYKDGAKSTSLETIEQNARRLTFAHLLKRMSSDAHSKVLKQIDWNAPTFTEIKSPEIAAEVRAWQAQYGTAENTNAQDIKCGSPIYLWNRLRAQEIATSEIPAEMIQQGQVIGG